MHGSAHVLCVYSVCLAGPALWMANVAQVVSSYNMGSLPARNTSKTSFCFCSVGRKIYGKNKPGGIKKARTNHCAQVASSTRTGRVVLFLHYCAGVCTIPRKSSLHFLWFCHSKDHRHQILFFSMMNVRIQSKLPNFCSLLEKLDLSYRKKRTELWVLLMHLQLFLFIRVS